MNALTMFTSIVVEKYEMQMYNIQKCIIVQNAYLHLLGEGSLKFQFKVDEILNKISQQKN